ncbi:aspartyl/asparaginyl beta-hydroxylase domain-containing protein [Brevundimonas balnearis]|uniref:Aspartyl/asparaginyl beta-hydroxylase domain-containing protein n=1 Tax=Brevundimonas balnearis TaxID=1572858 RepID=A0ABV6R1X4_9CAUL
MSAIPEPSAAEFQARLKAAEARLRADPADLEALIAKGDALARLGDERGAGAFHAAALRVARTRGASPALASEVRRIEAETSARAARFEAALREGVARAGHDPARSSERFTLSLDLLTGRKQLHLSAPRFYFFPGLPQVQFQPRESLPWIDRIEAATDEIASELEGLLADPDLFKPYVEPRGDRPARDAQGMVANADWSAVFLWKDGVEQREAASRCPRTLEALRDVPLCRVPGRTPSILFSRLTPGARIPPHHGLINTRLICHLPLIVPRGCRFRVGSDEREWERGEAWAFDDTVEHEAVNGSDRDRIILIFDVWKPELTDEERSLVSAMFQVIDGESASPAWGV